MIDQPSTTTREEVEHPAWCFGSSHCTAKTEPEYPRMVLGDHLKVTERFRSIWGQPYKVGVVQAGDSSDHLRVMLALPFDDQDSIAPGMTEEETDRLTPAQLLDLGQVMHLQPEEARMLARFLVEAADERDRLAGRAA
jgi:hypothetical protein